MAGELLRALARSTDSPNERAVLDNLADKAVGGVEVLYETGEQAPELKEKLVSSLAPATPKRTALKKKDKTMSDLMKQAEEKLTQAADTIDEQKTQIVELQEKLASADHREKAREIAMQMIDADRMDIVGEYETKVAELVEEDAEQLALTGKFVQYTKSNGGTPDSFLKVASVLDGTGEGGTPEERQAALREKFYKGMGVL